MFVGFVARRFPIENFRRRVVYFIGKTNTVFVFVSGTHRIIPPFVFQKFPFSAYSYQSAILFSEVSVLYVFDGFELCLKNAYNGQEQEERVVHMVKAHAQRYELGLLDDGNTFYRTYSPHQDIRLNRTSYRVKRGSLARRDTVPSQCPTRATPPPTIGALYRIPANDTEPRFLYDAH